MQQVRDRILAGSGTAIVLAGAGALLIGAFDVSVDRIRQTALALVDLQPAPPPPPPVRPPEAPARKERAREAPAPPAPKAKPTEIVAPPHPVLVAPPPPVVVAPVAGLGDASRSGASDHGTGQGAGGSGNGTGGGGEGGGDGEPPELIRGRLRFGDLPPDLRQIGWSGRVGVHYRVGVDGRVTDCGIDQPSGQPEVDAVTCQLIEQRFRYRPSRDENGRPVRSIVAETHEWIFRREPDGPN